MTFLTPLPQWLKEYLPMMNLAANLSYFSLVVIVVLVPLVLYKIHIATSRLVMEGDNLRHWYLVNK